MLSFIQLPFFTEGVLNASWKEKFVSIFISCFAPVFGGFFSAENQVNLSPALPAF
jgi:hypothetical protein